MSHIILLIHPYSVPWERCSFLVGLNVSHTHYPCNVFSVTKLNFEEARNRCQYVETSMWIAAQEWHATNKFRWSIWALFYSIIHLSVISRSNDTNYPSDFSHSIQSGIIAFHVWSPLQMWTISHACKNIEHMSHEPMSRGVKRATSCNFKHAHDHSSDASNFNTFTDMSNTSEALLSTHSHTENTSHEW